MTQTFKEAQAYEAKIQAAVVKQIRDNVFSVPSSRPGVYPQVVTTDEQGNANYCSCEHFEHNGWTRDGHKCYHAQATERFVAAQNAVAEAQAIVTQTPEQAQVERYVAGGFDVATARRIVEADMKPRKAHGNAKGYEPKAFSLL
jgi:predicted nucleic acid-binding Zn finger protein